MHSRITLHEAEAPVEARDRETLDRVIAGAGEEARAAGRLNVIFVTHDNGNELSLAVGGDETVLGFTYAHLDPPYYASKGPTESEDPVITAYVALEHHTEYPRTWVIPMEQGLSALYEFCTSGALPGCIEWAEV